MDRVGARRTYMRTVDACRGDETRQGKEGKKR